MRRIITPVRGLALAALLPAGAVHAQGPMPQEPVQPPIGHALTDGQPLVPQYAVKWREFQFTDLSALREDHLGIVDIDWALSGSQLYLAHGTRYTLTPIPDRQTGQRPVSTLAEPLPPLEAGPYYLALKYRQGSFFMKRGAAIYRYEPRQRRWDVHFAGTKAFTQFEILGGDRVALICPMPLEDQPKEITPLVTGVVNRDNGKVPLVEIYARSKPERPERVLPFPRSVAATLERVNDYPLVDRSLQIHDTYLLINGQAGQVFSFDARKQVVSHVETPWPSLDRTYLAGLDRLGLKPAWKEGMVKLSQFSFPVKIHPYLQGPDEVLFAVILNPVFEPGYSRNRDLQEGRLGNRFAPLPKEYTREENAQWTWMKYYRYAIGARKFTELKQPRLAALRLDFAEHWLTSGGEAMPLSSLDLGTQELPLQ